MDYTTGDGALTLVESIDSKDFPRSLRSKILWKAVVADGRGGPHAPLRAVCGAPAANEACTCGTARTKPQRDTGHPDPARRSSTAKLAA